jgi:hypothetical protein
VKNGDGTVSLVACNNLYVSSNNGNAPLIADRTAKNASQAIAARAHQAVLRHSRVTTSGSR